MYDWTHGESDYIEQVSHSLCTLEFKPHRDLYDWFLDQVVDKSKIRPKQLKKHENHELGKRRPSEVDFY